MNKLFDAQGKEIPPRPTWSEDSETIIRIALDKIFCSKHCYFEEHERKELASSLTSHYMPYCDEFLLAKDFEWDGWDVNREFVEQLKNIGRYLIEAESSLVKAWATEFAPVPPFEIGALLIGFDWRDQCEAVGTITGICNRPATYLVKFPDNDDNSRHLIRFEDAVLADEVKACQLR